MSGMNAYRDLDTSQWLALSIFASYFALILGLFYVIFARSIRWDSLGSKGWVFLGLTGASFAHTWFYMFRFMQWSFYNHESLIVASQGPLLTRFANWLVNTALFEQAWGAVCFGPFNWWWSEQLCLFTAGAWTVFIAIEGRRHGIRHLWAYMLLGQVVAISVASNLFYLALITSAPSKAKPNVCRLSPMIWGSVLLSMITVGLSPFTSDETFLPNLLVMHALLLAAVLPRRPQEPKALAMRPLVLYALIAVLSMVLRLRTTVAAYLTLPPTTRTPRSFALCAWETLHSHPAQASIGWDVVWTSFSFLIWYFTSMASEQDRSFVDIFNAVLQTAVLSAGVMAPSLFGRHVGIKEGAKKRE
ncbi:hypothetical protein GLOTRDRAFT_119191 [Gloeophyllum trabeum ATCC 11539]|uniref:Uncharacterized protein n=1 Tax=Gloeophyllum trabeum (strain ATCC 11539 / FP-39264 / Madison 617) TaxID=670483 RepID=S7S1K9_GLOTA|nr:uncharacterized protein GLOTRDRAFT_119191 [Gloeophyllum trabeum ATCC 11539]EPQ61340.1 hypothetical protein GLOTRDRAFT_119191 [Gloeophyllum trabeum ATCC 11539]